MSTSTYVLSWVGIVVLYFWVLFDVVQLNRPDDDWKGWVEPDVPYKRPRWGVQPGSLLRLMLIVPAFFLLLDWVKNDTASALSSWLKSQPTTMAVAACGEWQTTSS